MKKGIHPKYYPDAKIICACGTQYEVGATAPEIHIEICSACHPFYTGKQKLVDTAGRLEKFQARVAKKETLAARKGKTVKRAAKKVKAAAKAKKAEKEKK